MLKLNAAYSKKVPAESNYSSQQFHCQIEIELPDGLTQEQMQDRIHETFSLVRQSVETELQTAQQTMQTMQPQQQYPQQQYPQQQYPQQQYPQQNGYVQQPALSNQYQHGAANSKGKNERATQKQIDYMLKLMNGSNWTIAGIKSYYKVNRLEDLTSSQCSDLIQQMKGKAA